MTKRPLLQIGTFPAFIQEMIDAEFSCHSLAQVQESTLLQGQIRGLVTRSNYDLPDTVFGLLSNLGVIATYGVGYDKIPLALARQRGVLVSNTPGVLDGTVAELTLGLTLGLLHRIAAADRFVRASQWPHLDFPLGTGLRGKSVGIFGLGRIGKEIARRFQAFDVTLAYHGRTRQDLSLPYEASLAGLARQSDILVIAVPGGPNTQGVVDASVLEALGPNGYLVNISRGSVVDEAALIQALEQGTIAGAALDVFQNEPNIDPRFLTLDRALLTPHVGSATFETRQAMARLVLENLQRFFQDGTVLTPVQA